MITDKPTFDENLDYYLFMFQERNDTQETIKQIKSLLIPTLNWKDNLNVSFSTGGGYMCVIRKTDDAYTTTAPVGFTGTLDECKHYCSVWVREEYLKLCGNGQ